MISAPDFAPGVQAAILVVSESFSFGLHKAKAKIHFYLPLKDS
jgi:hypothetical protein